MNITKLLTIALMAISIAACEQPGGDSEAGGGGGGETGPFSAPTWTSVTPTSPSNSDIITLAGLAPERSTVKFYLAEGCTTFLGQVKASSTGTFTYTNTTPLAPDTTYTIYAKAFGTAGESSDCSAPITYVEDSTAPATPVGLARSFPATPAANENNPIITGTTDPNATVVIYKDSFCTVAGNSGAADEFGAFSITVNVSDNTTTSFYARAKDDADNWSACSASFVTYIEDSQGPAAPTGLATNPVSPNLSDTPMVTGVAEPNAQIGIFTNSACSNMVASGTADGNGDFNIQVNVGENTTQWFYARGTDAAGNVGPCSASNVKYVNDSLAPGITSLTLGSASPYNNNNPFINGTTEANAAVTIYSDAGCTTVKGSGTATAGGVFSIQVNVADNSVTNFHAKPIDSAGNVGLCTSFFVTFIEDSVPPASPSALATNPVSPSGNNFPQVTGSAEAGTTIRIYSNAACTNYLGMNITDGTGYFAVSVNVPNDSTTTLYATATDPAGSTSPCSTSNVSYTHDSGPPAAPTSLGVAPSSPSNQTNVTISGVSEANAIVKLYVNGSCSGLPANTGSADSNGNFAIPVTVNSNSSTTYWAQATDLASNVGPCSTEQITFVNDTINPSAPVGLAVSPASPANNNSPSVTGTAESNAFVTVFSDAACTVSVGSGNAAANGSFSVTASVLDNTTSAFYAKAMDLAGNIGPCSTVFASYVEDSVVPLTPHSLAVSPLSPANDNAPTVSGTTDPNVTVRLYTNSTCSNLAATGAADGAGFFSVPVAVSDDTSTTYWARATDQAGNNSACSASNVAFVEDSTAPTTPVGLSSSPLSPANNNNPSITGFSDAGAAIEVFNDITCTTLRGSGTVGGGGSFTIPVTVFNDTSNSYYAKATDAAGNESACSTATVSFVEDSTPPGEPTGIASNPISPANANSVLIGGNTDANSTVGIYTDALCTNLAGSGTANGAGVFSINIIVSDNTTTTFYAKSTDAAGNPGPCSTSYVTYQEDSSLPSTPTSLALSPTSPANNNNPNISGVSEPNATVRVYSNSICTNLVATATADGSGMWNVTFAVSDNTTATYWARSTDGANNNSPCSSENVTYIEDSNAPGIPASLAVSPTSPSSNNNPTVSGLTDPNTSVSIYSDSGCTSIRGTGTSNGGGVFSIAATVFADTTTTYYAKAVDAAGNQSACSTSNVTYVEDSTAPTAPTALASAPSGTANNNNPTISGTAEANTNIALYTDPSCLSSVVATGTVNGGGSFSIGVAVLDNTSTTFYAKSTDGAGNASPCSSSSVTYIEDSSAPAVPTSLAISPNLPRNNNNSPVITGSTDANATVKVYTNSSCTSAVIASGSANGSGNFSINIPVSDDTSYTFYALAEDGAANQSTCSATSVSYIEDSIAPAQPLALSVTPASPANNDAPFISGSAEANSSVAVYADSGCTDLKGTGTANGIGTFSIQVAVSNNSTTTFYARASDAANNVGACSAANVVYVEDSTAPALPVSMTVNPLSPANNNNITVGGTTDANANVSLYTNSTCTSGIAGSGTANGGGMFSIAVSVSDNTSTTFYAKATDTAGNASSCSVANVTFVEDSAAPAAPTSLASSPASPSPDETPDITGTAEANAVINLYTNSSCTSSVVGTGTANGVGNFGITVTLTPDTNYSLYATATDASGNTSACSISTVNYVEDSTAPGLPVGLDVSPVSPANDNNPFITGSAEANSSVSVYSDSGCTVLKGTGSANGLGVFNIQVSVTNNTSTTFYAKATDAAGNVGNCSTANVTFVEDSNGPAAPTSLASSPVGPANNNNINITGNSEANADIALYTNSSCTSSIAGSGVADGSGAFSIAISVADNSTTTFYAQSTDSANNVSACSAAGATYIEDSAAPAAPVSLVASPLSPSSNNNPDLTGSAEANSTVRLYTNSSCTSAIAGTGAANGVGNFSINVSVTADTTTTFYATATDTAGNTSVCSTDNRVYVEDSTAPGLPVGLDVTPVSPANDNSPFITGSAEANSTVSVYSDAGCTVLKGTGAANGLGVFNIQVSVTNNTTTNFYAKATDAAGNVGNCSVSTVAFVEDSTAPNAPTGIDIAPVGPANNNNITISGTAEANSAIDLYTNPTCTSAIFASGSADGGGSFSLPVAVTDNTTTTFYAKATDSSGNTSACSTSNDTYIEDSMAPTAPINIGSTPPPPSNVNAPDITGSAEPNSTVRLYTNASCTSTLAGIGVASGAGNFAISVSVSDDTTTNYYATATDPVGNTSLCSTAFIAYVEDSQKPDKPTGLVTTPASPNLDLQPFVSGSAEANATVRIYSDATCTTLKGTGVATGLGSFNIQVAITGNTTTTFYARATDVAGNLGDCSDDSYTYVNDAIPPLAPVFTSVTPSDGPANQNNITLIGTAEADTTLLLYSDLNCTNQIDTGTVDGSGNFSINRTVPNDSTSNFYAKVRDISQNLSPCSTTFVTYIEDSSAPNPPINLASTPSLPANNNENPSISGNTEANAVINLYTNSACTGGAYATAAANGSGNFSIPVTVTSNSTQTFYATATDSSGNTSGCSTSSITYIEDSINPPIPGGFALSPTSPNFDTAPYIAGSAEANSTVRIYSDASCSLLKGTGTANGIGAFNIQVSVTANTSTTLYAQATDSANNVSPCSSTVPESITYVNDTGVPAAPTLATTTPASPANDTTITVNGTGEANQTVYLYSNSNCTTLITTQAIDGSGNFAVPVTVGDDTTTTFYAKVRDAAQNYSTCSVSNITYVEDSTPPAAPLALTTIPLPPSSENNPVVTGTSEASANVDLYTNSTCTSGIFATGTADGSGNFNIPVSLTADTSYSFWAKARDAANNPGPCSSVSANYIEDSTPPAAPGSLGSTPNAASNNNNTPSITGSAEANSTIRIYSDASCTTLRATGTANGSGLFSVAVAVGDDTTTTFYATAQDGALNTGPCSTSNVTYVEDSSNPAAPLFGSPSSNPVSPSNANSPLLLGTAESGSTVTVYSDPGCSTVAGVGVATGGNFSIMVSVSADTTSTFYAKAVDAANNSSACSTSTAVYVEDSILPATPSILSFSPNSPSSDETPNVAGSAEPNSDIDLYTNASCTSALAGFGTANGSGLFNITNVTVANDSVTTFYALSTDAAGNSSACSSGLTFTEDSSAPGAPVSLAVTGGNRQNNNTPFITGNAEAFSTVRLYTTNDCSGTAVNPAGDTVPVTTLFSIQVTVSDDSTTTFYARATDLAGNVGPCSSNYVTYEEDTAPPMVPHTLATNPVGFGNDQTPDVTGSTEANASVAIYTDPSCGTAAVGSGSANGSGNFTISSAASANTTTTFYAKAVDSIGNQSVCSGLDSPPKSIAYVHDSLPPAAPNTFASVPESPSNVNNPIITGNAEANSTVSIWRNATCDSGFVISGAANGSGVFSLQPTLAGDTTHQLYFKATDQAGNGGTCSTLFTYVEDSTAPAAPAFGSPGSSPVSPSFNNRPTMLGTAADGSTVKLFTNSSCTGGDVGSGVATGGNFSIQINAGTITADGLTTFYATATDTAGNESSCSGGGSNVPYILDTQNPGDPTIAIAPATSPNQATSVTISGTAESLATVKLYTNASCTEPSASSGIAIAGNYSINHTVTADTTTVFTTRVFDPANNQSGCSSVISYTNDTIAPSVPNNLNVSPTSPSPSNDITITGTAEANSWVYLYTNIDCTSAVFGSGQANSGGAFSINITSITSNQTYDIYARSQDAALNPSGCSGIVYGQVAGRWVQYIEDSAPPGDPTFTSITPNNPLGNNDNYPDIEGSTSPNAIVRIYNNNNCTEPYSAQGNANGSGVFTFNQSGAQDVQAAADTTTIFSVKAWDAAGNFSGCTASGTYLEDSIAPVVPAITGVSPTSPSNVNTPSISGTAEALATIRLYTDSLCNGSIAATGSANGSGVFSVGTTVSADTTTTFWARAVDAAGNVGPCSETHGTPGSRSVVYVEDSTPPAAPVWTSTLPSIESDDHTPTISGTAEANSTVKLYNSNTCGTQIGSTTANGGGTFSINPTFADNANVNIHMTATDAAGNASACPVAATTTYLHYTIPEGVGYFEGDSLWTGTALSSNFNNTTAYEVAWNVRQRYHSTYYTYNSATYPERIYVNTAGSYLLSINFGITSATNSVDNRVSVRVNGSVRTYGGCVAHSFVATGTKRPTATCTVLAENLSANDYIDLQSIRVGANAATNSDGISLTIRYVDTSTTPVFTATATTTTAGASNTNFNQTTEYYIRWVESIENSIYTHDDATNPQNITLTEAGDYLVAINIPLTSTANYGSVRTTIYGGSTGTTAIPGGVSAAVSGTSGNREHSQSWVGIISGVAANDILRVGVIREGTSTGTMPVIGGRAASIYIEKLPNTDGVFKARGTDLTSNSTFSSSLQSVRWTTQDIYDSSVFSHNTATNPEEVTVLEAGDYEVTYTNYLTGNATDTTTDVRVLVNGSDSYNSVSIAGATTRNAMTENTSGNNETSGAFGYILRNVSANSIITVTSQAYIGSGTLTGNAMLTIRKIPRSTSP